MSIDVTAARDDVSLQDVPEPQSTQRRAWRIIARNRLAMAGLVIVILWVLLAILAPLVTRYDPITSQDAYNTLSGPTSTHWLGTDDTGRDVLSRLAYGGRASLGIGVLVVLAGMLIGLLLGGIAGFTGGALDELIMRLADIVFAFPIIVLAMAVSAALGPSLTNAAIAMIVVWWPTYARVVRGLVLAIREREFVTAARAVGASEWRILLRTVLPNTIGPVVVLATLDIGNAILTVAGLSFIGFGVPPPNPEWGAMISEAQKYPDQWWMFVFPGVAIFTSIMGFNFFGDALRDALDPRTR
ncbi:MAG TPA: ABC transporter permease [Chloroflexota bacterium]|nr:ABC transporter permease [Chloroflexota bacterium]